MKNNKRIPYKKLYLLLMGLMTDNVYAETTISRITKKQINLVNPMNNPIVLHVDNSSNNKNFEYQYYQDGQPHDVTTSFPTTIEIPADSTISILPGAQINFYNYGNTGDNVFIYAQNGFYVTNNITGAQRMYYPVVNTSVSNNNQWIGFYVDPTVAWNGMSDNYYLDPADSKNGQEVLNGNQEVYKASNLNYYAQVYADYHLAPGVSLQEAFDQYASYFASNPNAEVAINLNSRSFNGTSQNPFDPQSPMSMQTEANLTGDFSLLNQPDYVYLSGAKITNAIRNNAVLNLFNSDTYYLSGQDLSYSPAGANSSVTTAPQGKGVGTEHTVLTQTNLVNNSKQPITFYSVSGAVGGGISGGNTLLTLPPGSTLVIPAGTHYEYSSTVGAYYIQLPSDAKPYILNPQTGQKTYFGGYNQWYSVAVGGANKGPLNWEAGQDEGVSFGSAVDLATEYQQGMPTKDPDGFYDGTAYNVNNNLVAAYNENPADTNSYENTAKAENKYILANGATYDGNQYTAGQVKQDEANLSPLRLFDGSETFLIQPYNPNNPNGNSIVGNNNPGTKNKVKPSNSYVTKKQVNLDNNTGASIILKGDNGASFMLGAGNTLVIPAGTKLNFYNYGNSKDNVWVEFNNEGGGQPYVLANNTGQKTYLKVQDQWYGFYIDPQEAWHHGQVDGDNFNLNDGSTSVAAYSVNNNAMPYINRMASEEGISDTEEISNLSHENLDYAANGTKGGMSAQEYRDTENSLQPWNADTYVLEPYNSKNPNAISKNAGYAGTLTGNYVATKQINLENSSGQSITMLINGKNVTFPSNSVLVLPTGTGISFYNNGGGGDELTVTTGYNGAYLVNTKTNAKTMLPLGTYKMNVTPSAKWVEGQTSADTYKDYKKITHSTNGIFTVYDVNNVVDQNLYDTLVNKYGLSPYQAQKVIDDTRLFLHEGAKAQDGLKKAPHKNLNTNLTAEDVSHVLNGAVGLDITKDEYNSLTTKDKLSADQAHQIIKEQNDLLSGIAKLSAQLSQEPKSEDNVTLIADETNKIKVIEYKDLTRKYGLSKDEAKAILIYQQKMFYAELTRNKQLAANFKAKLDKFIGKATVDIKNGLFKLDSIDSKLNKTDIVGQSEYISSYVKKKNLRTIEFTELQHKGDTLSQADKVVNRVELDLFDTVVVDDIVSAKVKSDAKLSQYDIYKPLDSTNFVISGYEQIPDETILEYLKEHPAQIFMEVVTGGLWTPVIVGEEGIKIAVSYGSEDFQQDLRDGMEVFDLTSMIVMIATAPEMIGQALMADEALVASSEEATLFRDGGDGRIARDNNFKMVDSLEKNYNDLGDKWKSRSEEIRAYKEKINKAGQDAAKQKKIWTELEARRIRMNKVFKGKFDHSDVIKDQMKDLRGKAVNRINHDLLTKTYSPADTKKLVDLMDTLAKPEFTKDNFNKPLEELAKFYKNSGNRVDLTSLNNSSVDMDARRTKPVDDYIDKEEKILPSDKEKNANALKDNYNKYHETLTEIRDTQKNKQLDELIKDRKELLSYQKVDAYREARLKYAKDIRAKYSNKLLDSFEKLQDKQIEYLNNELEKIHSMDDGIAKDEAYSSLLKTLQENMQGGIHFPKYASDKLDYKYQLEKLKQIEKFGAYSSTDAEGNSVHAIVAYDKDGNAMTNGVRNLSDSHEVNGKKYHFWMETSVDHFIKGVRNDPQYKEFFDAFKNKVKTSKDHDFMENADLISKFREENKKPSSMMNHVNSLNMKATSLTEMEKSSLDAFNQEMLKEYNPVAEPTIPAVVEDPITTNNKMLRYKDRLHVISDETNADINKLNKINREIKENDILRAKEQELFKEQGHSYKNGKYNLELRLNHDDLIREQKQLELKIKAHEAEIQNLTSKLGNEPEVLNVREQRLNLLQSRYDDIANKARTAIKAEIDDPDTYKGFHDMTNDWQGNIARSQLFNDIDLAEFYKKVNQGNFEDANIAKEVKIKNYDWNNIETTHEGNVWTVQAKPDVKTKYPKINFSGRVPGAEFRAANFVDAAKEISNADTSLYDLVMERNRDPYMAMHLYVGDHLDEFVVENLAEEFGSISQLTDLELRAVSDGIKTGWADKGVDNVKPPKSIREEFERRNRNVPAQPIVDGVLPPVDNNPVGMVDSDKLENPSLSSSQDVSGADKSKPSHIVEQQNIAKHIQQLKDEIVSNNEKIDELEKSRNKVFDEIEYAKDHGKIKELDLQIKRLSSSMEELDVSNNEKERMISTLKNLHNQLDVIEKLPEADRSIILKKLSNDVVDKAVKSELKETLATEKSTVVSGNKASTLHLFNDSDIFRSVAKEDGNFKYEAIREDNEDGGVDKGDVSEVQSSSNQPMPVSIAENNVLASNSDVDAPVAEQSSNEKYVDKSEEKLSSQIEQIDFDDYKGYPLGKGASGEAYLNEKNQTVFKKFKDLDTDKVYSNLKEFKTRTLTKSPKLTLDEEVIIDNIQTQMAITRDLRAPERFVEVFNDIQRKTGNSELEAKLVKTKEGELGALTPYVTHPDIDVKDTKLISKLQEALAKRDIYIDDLHIRGNVKFDPMSERYIFIDPDLRTILDNDHRRSFVDELVNKGADSKYKQLFDVDNKIGVPITYEELYGHSYASTSLKNDELVPKILNHNNASSNQPIMPASAAENNALVSNSDVDAPTEVDGGDKNPANSITGNSSHYIVEPAEFSPKMEDVPQSEIDFTKMINSPKSKLSRWERFKNLFKSSADENNEFYKQQEQHFKEKHFEALKASPSKVADAPSSTGDGKLIRSDKGYARFEQNYTPEEVEKRMQENSISLRKLLEDNGSRVNDMKELKRGDVVVIHNSTYGKAPDNWAKHGYIYHVNSISGDDIYGDVFELVGHQIKPRFIFGETDNVGYIRNLDDVRDVDKKTTKISKTLSGAKSHKEWLGFKHRSNVMFDPRGDELSKFKYFINKGSAYKVNFKVEDIAKSFKDTYRDLEARNQGYEGYLYNCNNCIYDTLKRVHDQRMIDTVAPENLANELNSN